MKRIALLSLITASFVSCGSICDRLESASKGIETKAKGCTGSTTTTDKFNKSTCESSLSNCNADDTKKINDYITCLEQVPTCSGDAISWSLGSLLPCAAKLSGLSASCTTGL